MFEGPPPGTGPGSRARVDRPPPPLFVHVSKDRAFRFALYRREKPRPRIFDTGTKKLPPLWRTIPGDRSPEEEDV
jgi:hypothetical protein